mmetsp:Transcript_51160/g.59780  ORF Transcript_51160/g.59780 Transcript_51160/m.59780 type:complete len:828 (+) Transcript_51160:265-2748(+)|eukprot:CAMPEP_0194419760 /NCGR_PEP_ID=MMETSP0176-20130528/18926_1 /TAXON_ID=216777 /ORGANISM="Proboscia alata, Strain PI-D3" /LENGTH=827 /DNA_ID=CAMNT_0039226903 /DNA_START=199 /DNA_END=2679 /DNA_ORIENTATION=+
MRNMIFLHSTSSVLCVVILICAIEAQHSKEHLKAVGDGSMEVRKGHAFLRGRSTDGGNNKLPEADMEQRSVDDKAISAPVTKDLNEVIQQMQSKIENDLSNVERDANNVMRKQPSAQKEDSSSNVSNMNRSNKDLLGKYVTGSKVLSNATIEEARNNDISIDHRDKESSNDDSDENKLIHTDLETLKKDIETLLKTFIIVREKESAKAKNLMKETERTTREHAVELEAAQIIDDLHNGRVQVDYITGNLLSSLPKRQQKKNGKENYHISNTAPDKVYVKGLESVDNISEKTKEDYSFHQESNGPMEHEIDEWIDTLEHSDDASSGQEMLSDEEKRHKIEFLHNIQDKLRHEIDLRKETSDPAVMHIDLQLLLDIVTLAIAASIFGLVAVFLGLPPTAGFLLGGMMIGPSCWNLVEEVKQLQTLAQFGSIFLLFEQGLLYAQTYTSGLSRPQQMVQRKTSRTDDHDPSVVGVIVLAILVLSSVIIFFTSGAVKSLLDAILLSVSVSICSSAVVTENIYAAGIADTVWAKRLNKMVAIQDLFMVPLLAIPELIGTLMEENGTFFDFMFYIISAALFLKGSVMFAPQTVNAAVIAESRMAHGELFTLSIVAYALMMATISEELNFSIEAGAVLAGIVLLNSPHIPKIRESIKPIKSVFGGMFLTSLGMIISPAFVINQSASIACLVVFIALFKTVVVSSTMYSFFDYPLSASVAFGGSMAQISEASLVVMAKAQRHGFVNRKTYLMLIPTTCILLILAPLSKSTLRLLKSQEDDDCLPICPRWITRCLHLRNYTFKHGVENKSDESSYESPRSNNHHRTPNELRKISRSH